MSEYVTLKAADGFELSAYVARPDGEPIAALIVVQETTDGPVAQSHRAFPADST